MHCAQPLAWYDACMDHDKLEHFKKRLTEEFKLVEQELKSLGVADEHAPGGWDATPGDIDDTATEPDELADRIEELEGNEQEIKEIGEQKKNIERALAKLEEGTYGVCEISGHPIEEDRLEANPSARTCKEHLEQESELSE